MSLPFRCPVCHGPLSREPSVFRCARGHSFDIARQGYVNLLLRKPDHSYESRALFVARRAVYLAGFFDPMVAAIRRLMPEGPVLDAGCGEGSLLHRLAADGRDAVGLDIAKPAVQMAAAAYKKAAWCVGDLCALPLPDASIATIVNVLTPANYQEFARVLTDGGTLVKVIPGTDHLREIRALTGMAPYAAHEEATDIFQRTFALSARETLRYQVDCDSNLAAQVFAMTPLTAHAEPVDIPPQPITVHVTLLKGEKKATPT